MSNDFKQFMIDNGIVESTSLVYASTLRSGIKRKNLRKVRGWSAASRWAAKYALSTLSEDDSDLAIGGLFEEEESETQEQEVVIVKVIDESTIQDLVGILSMALDDGNKLSIIKSYIDGRSMQIASTRVP